MRGDISVLYAFMAWCSATKSTGTEKLTYFMPVEMYENPFLKISFMCTDFRGSLWNISCIHNFIIFMTQEELVFLFTSIFLSEIRFRK
jgi:hypothetical protein